MISLSFVICSGVRNVLILLGSVAANFILLSLLIRVGEKRKLLVLWLLVGTNCLLLGYYKYVGFFLDNLALLWGGQASLAAIVLPLGISFYSFNQIAYGVSIYRGRANRLPFVQYFAVTTFFPYLVAGPLVDFDNIAHQLNDGRGSVWSRDLAMGLSLVVVGLFKKVVLGDSLAVYADHVFSFAATAPGVDFVHAWVGALSYTFQIYFDFSGYTDMAMGVARIFGVVLPPNFNSPYKAANIGEFWRRWHISLSKFFRDYLYIPLGGNRRGMVRLHTNLLMTMVLCGLWHGAGWTFVLWGGLHGLYLSGHRLLSSLFPQGIIGRVRGVRVAVTFVFLVVSWVIFRAESIGVAAKIYQGMIGSSGFLELSGVIKLSSCWQWLAGAAILSFGMPNSQQIFSDHNPSLIYRGYNDNLSRPQKLLWKPKFAGVLVVYCLWLVALYHIDRGGSFIYAQF